jgi:hypothetical protein
MHRLEQQLLNKLQGMLVKQCDEFLLTHRTSECNVVSSQAILLLTLTQHSFFTFDNKTADKSMSHTSINPGSSMREVLLDLEDSSDYTYSAWSQVSDVIPTYLGASLICSQAEIEIPYTPPDRSPTTLLATSETDMPCGLLQKEGPRRWRITISRPNKPMQQNWSQIADAIIEYSDVSKIPVHAMTALECSEMTFRSISKKRKLAMLSSSGWRLKLPPSRRRRSAVMPRVS